MSHWVRVLKAVEMDPRHRTSSKTSMHGRSMIMRSKRIKIHGEIKMVKPTKDQKVSSYAFLQSCKRHEVRATTRQFSKWNNGRGILRQLERKAK